MVGFQMIKNYELRYIFGNPKNYVESDSYSRDMKWNLKYLTEREIQRYIVRCKNIVIKRRFFTVKCQYAEHDWKSCDSRII